MEERLFEAALESIMLAGFIRDAKHVCPPCSCWEGPVGWHRHCNGECNPTAFGLADIPESER